MKTIFILLISLFSFCYAGELQAQVGAQTTPVPCESGNANATNIKYKVNGKIKTTLKGNVFQGDTVEVTFTIPNGKTPTRYSLVAYNASANSTSSTVRKNHIVYDYDMHEFEPGTHTLSVFIPNNYFEVDFVKGCIIWKFDGVNGYNNRLVNGSNGGVNAACAGCNEKITICHIPKGNPANAHSITISVKAAEAHLGEHGGDYLGECIDSLDVTVDCDSVTAISNRKIETITLLLVYYRVDQITGEPVPSSIDSTIEVVNVNATSKTIYVTDFNFGFDEVCAVVGGEDTCTQYYKDFKIYGAYVLLDGHNESDVLDESWTGSEVTVYGQYSPNPNYEICDRLIDIPLPVVLTKFNATKLEPSVVKLEWTTASETNNDYIAIEKSTDIENWKEVCRVQSAAPGGNSQHVHDYTCYDNKADEDGQNIIYYRPKQVDLNGTYEYHNTIRVRLQDAAYATEIQNVYPNPATNRLNIKYNASENGVFNLRLISLDGKSLLENRFVSKPGIQTYDLDLMEDKLTPGLYVLEIQTETEVFRQKVYKQ